MQKNPVGIDDSASNKTYAKVASNTEGPSTSAFQRRNKKNLKINIIPGNSRAPNVQYDSVGTASSLIPFGRTPEEGIPEEIPPTSRTDIRNQSQRTVNREPLRLRDGPQSKLHWK